MSETKKSPEILPDDLPADFGEVPAANVCRCDELEAALRELLNSLDVQQRNGLVRYENAVASARALIGEEGGE